MTSGARAITPGRILYITWYAPLAFFRRVRESGAWNLFRARVGEARMRRAAYALRPVAEPAADAPEVYFLSGRRFVHQTVFCAASLAAHAGRSYRVIVVDDGTLQDEDAQLLRRVLRGVRVISPGELEAALDRRLPRARFPRLRHHRIAYKHIRKLTDVHALGGGYKMVLDSDMLFHRPPEFLLRWLECPTRPCHMVDVADAYGYSPGLLAELAGGPLPPRVNVGLCGLSSDAMPWEVLERWCGELLQREGSHYLMEQALVAMLLTSRDSMVAPAIDYVVAPSRAQVERPRAALHHYTAESKSWYFRFGWRQALHALEGVDGQAESSHG